LLRNLIDNLTPRRSTTRAMPPRSPGSSLTRTRKSYSLPVSAQRPAELRRGAVRFL